jgi:hypothetical protein
MKKKRERKEALWKFKEKDCDESRIEHWVSRKAYERAAGKKRCILQERVAECINKLVRN